MHMSTLFYTPPGTGLDDCLERFQRSLCQDPFQARLIVPSSGLARSITKHMSGHIPAFRKNAVTTPAQFAEELIREKSPESLVIDDLLARQVLTDILRTSEEGSLFFHSVANPGRAADLYTLFQEIGAYQDEEAFFSRCDSPKIAGIALLYHHYRSVLSRNNLVDGPSVFRKATTLEPDRDLHLFVYGIWNPYPDLRALLRHLERNVAAFTCYHPYSENRKICTDRAEWLGAGSSGSIPAREEHLPFVHLFSGAEAGNRTSTRLLVHEFASPRDEVESIAQEVLRLLEEGFDFNDIAIGAPDLSAATTLINEVFPQCGLPFTSTATIPLSESPVVQAFVHLLEIPVAGYRREDVVEAYASPYLGLLRGQPRLTPAIVDRIARAAFIVDGHAAWTTNPSLLVARLQNELESPDTPDYRRKDLEDEIALGEAVAAHTRAVLARLRVLEQPATVHGHIRNVRAFLSSLDAPLPDVVSTPREGDDLREFARLLGRMETGSTLFDGHEMPYADFVRVLKAEVQKKRVQRYRTGRGIRVSGLRELHDRKVPVLFLMALTDERLPYVPGLLPFLTDAEGNALNPDMKSMNLRNERYYFVSALCAATDRLYLTCTSAPSRGGLIPSPFFREVRQAIPVEEWSPPPQQASRRYRQRYAGRCLGEGRLPDPQILPEIGDAAQLAEIVNRVNIEYVHRCGGYDSPFDGMLGGDEAIRAALGRRFGDSTAYSVSKFERYAACPFSFYAHDVLGLEALPDVEITLSPADRGTLVHRILAQFYARWVEGNGHPPRPEDRDACREQLRAITEKELAEFGKDGPAWDAFRSDLLGTGGYQPGILERFLDTEIARGRSPLRPAQFECSFGLSGRGTSISAGPVTIPVRGSEGASFKIHGIIDRVDLAEDGTFAITDYKTGNHSKLPEILDGTSLQLPLYIRAYEIVTGKRGVAGAYYKLHRKDVYHRAELYDTTHPFGEGTFTARSRMGELDFHEAIEQAICAAWASIQAIRAGVFHPPTTSCDSGYCDFKRICRFDEIRTLGFADGGEE